MPSRISSSEFSKRLYAFMAEKRINQSDLARAIWGTRKDTSGYPVAKNRDRISKYLQGESRPNKANMKLIAKCLGVAVEDLDPSMGDNADPDVPGATPLSMQVLAGEQNMARLVIDKVVPTHLAIKILNLLNEES